MSNLGVGMMLNVGEPIKDRYTRKLIRLLPNVYEYELIVPVRLESGEQYHVAFFNSMVSFWYKDNGFSPRRYTLHILGSGSLITHNHRIILALPNILIAATGGELYNGTMESKESETVGR